MASAQSAAKGSGLEVVANIVQVWIPEGKHEKKKINKPTRIPGRAGCLQQRFCVQVPWRWLWHGLLGCSLGMVEWAKEWAGGTNIALPAFIHSFILSLTETPPLLHPAQRPHRQRHSMVVGPAWWKLLIISEMSWDKEPGAGCFSPGGDRALFWQVKPDAHICIK